MTNTKNTIHKNFGDTRIHGLKGMLLLTTARNDLRAGQTVQVFVKKAGREEPATLKKYAGERGGCHYWAFSRNKTPEVYSQDKQEKKMVRILTALLNAADCRLPEPGAMAGNDAVTLDLLGDPFTIAPITEPTVGFEAGFDDELNRKAFATRWEALAYTGEIFLNQLRSYEIWGLVYITGDNVN